MLEPIKDYQYRDCILKVDGPIATFMFSNPTARNSSTALMYEGLYNAVASIKENDEIRVLVVTGDPEGRAFHGGLNVKRRAGVADTEEAEFTPGTPYYRIRERGGGLRGSGGDTLAVHTAGRQGLRRGSDPHRAGGGDVRDQRRPGTARHAVQGGAGGAEPHLEADPRSQG